MRKQIIGIFSASLLIAPAAQATLVGVSGPDSSLGTAASIIATPGFALDDMVTNAGMQGFDEAQGVTTSVAYEIDGGGTIAAGTQVDSHMIFLNSEGPTELIHEGVTWTFDGVILGVMSDSYGLLEAASTFELGAPGTSYDAPYKNRGLEGSIWDGYSILGNEMTVSMRVTEPGDWIRVVTAAASPVPIPAALPLFGPALGLLGFAGWRKRRSES